MALIFKILIGFGVWFVISFIVALILGREFKKAHEDVEKHIEPPHRNFEE